MASLWKLFSTIVKKRWEEANVVPPPKTSTPMADLNQRSAVAIDSVPIILAEGAKSLVKHLPERGTVTAVGLMYYGNIEYYRVYLSQSDGCFLHLATKFQNIDPIRKILECRLFQPYHEIIPESATPEEARHRMGLSPETKIDEAMTWSFWLLDNPDPNVGGMIGCPVMQGKEEDGNIQYQRSTMQINGRVMPLLVAEKVVDSVGGEILLHHQMMGYQRTLDDGKTLEYLLVSAVLQPGQPDTMSINMWIGIDIKPADLTVYAGR